MKILSLSLIAGLFVSGQSFNSASGLQQSSIYGPCNCPQKVITLIAQGEIIGFEMLLADRDEDARIKACCGDEINKAIQRQGRDYPKLVVKGPDTIAQELGRAIKS